MRGLSGRLFESWRAYRIPMFYSVVSSQREHIQKPSPLKEEVYPGTLEIDPKIPFEILVCHLAPPRTAELCADQTFTPIYPVKFIKISQN